jgi:hypothetical protein
VEAQVCENGEGMKEGILNRAANRISNIPFKRILDMPVKEILNIKIAV